MAETSGNSEPDQSRTIHFRPIDELELRHIREQQRQFTNDRSLNAGHAYVRGSTEFRHKSVEFSVDYSKIFINTNLIINAGAILALLTFLGSLFGKGNIAAILLASHLSASLTTAFLFFAAGLISIVLCAAVAYLNWMFVSQSWMGVGELMIWQSGLPPMPVDDPDRADRFIMPTLYAAVFFGVSSTVLFACGCYAVLQAFNSLDFFRFLRG